MQGGQIIEDPSTVVASDGTGILQVRNRNTVIPSSWDFTNHDIFAIHTYFFDTSFIPDQS